MCRESFQAAIGGAAGLAGIRYLKVQAGNAQLVCQ